MEQFDPRLGSAYRLGGNSSNDTVVRDFIGFSMTPVIWQRLRQALPGESHQQR